MGLLVTPFFHRLQPAKRTLPNTSRNKSSHTQRTENKTTNVVIHQHSRKLLKMDILMSETCWAHNKWNKIASVIKSVFHSSTIAMMRGPINIRITIHNQAVSHSHYKYSKNVGAITLGNKYRYSTSWGTVVAQWLRCCAINRKVAGSIPADVIGILHWHKILPIALWPWGPLCTCNPWKKLWELNYWCLVVQIHAGMKQKMTTANVCVTLSKPQPSQDYTDFKPSPKA